MSSDHDDPLLNRPAHEWRRLLELADEPVEKPDAAEEPLIGLANPQAAHPRFHAERPTDLRSYRPWHRLAYIIWLLPRRLGALAPLLELPPEGRVLDYGCAEKPYRRFFGNDVDFVGADLPGNPDADIQIDAGGTVGVPDESFDAVLSTQVLEHVAEPAVYLRECYRVLKPGGRILLSTHGLMVYHPDPVDLWRWTGAGLEQALRSAGFEICHREGVMGLSAAGMQFVQDSLYWRLPRRLGALLATVMQVVVALLDRFESPEIRRDHALVFAVVAEKPER